jgi:hypothetical protein
MAKAHIATQAQPTEPLVYKMFIPISKVFFQPKSKMATTPEHTTCTYIMKNVLEIICFSFKSYVTLCTTVAAFMNLSQKSCDIYTKNTNFF